VFAFPESELSENVQKTIPLTIGIKRVKEAECSENIMYSCMKMEK
jgi:hypothetical protein